MNQDFPTKKRKRNSSIGNDKIFDLESKLWNVKIFETKPALEKYLKDNCYKFRSTEVNTKQQRCRFCMALNPNSLQHMVQVYLNCKQCNLNSINNCSKTNICEKLKKYELLTRHQDLSPEEWIIFDKDNTAISNPQLPGTSLNQLKSFDMNSDQLANNLLEMNISSKITSEYYKNELFYVWIVQDILPSNVSLFKETYIIKIDNEWIEFFNGEEKHIFSQITTFSDGYILRRDDDSIFKLNSNQFYNCDEEEIKYEGEWVCDKNMQNPCVECSARIEKMVFECDHLANQLDDLNESNEKRVWKAKINIDSKYFKRRDIDTWEEYSNDKITDTFKFIGFDKSDDLIIQRNSKEFPDYLRFTNRDVFIGTVRDYIYTPLYTGFWQK